MKNNMQQFIQIHSNGITPRLQRIAAYDLLNYRNNYCVTFST